MPVPWHPLRHMTHAPHHRGSNLLPWEVASEELVLPAAGSTGPAAAASAAPPLSLVDRLAAPLAFMHQALVFERPLDAGRLREALARTQALFPTLACRASQDEVRAGQLLKCLLPLPAVPL